jgi:hypothetical protein
MVIAISLIALVVIVLWLLLAPFSLYLDTYRDDYCLRWRSLGSARLLLLEGELAIRLHIGPWRRDLYPLRPSAKQKTANQHKEQLPKKKRSFPWRKMQRVLQSFTIRELHLEIDTGDYARNAWLYPLVYAIKPLRQHVQVNFLGRNEGVLVVENRLWKIAWAMLRA